MGAAGLSHRLPPQAGGARAGDDLDHERRHGPRARGAAALSAAGRQSGWRSTSCTSCGRGRGDRLVAPLAHGLEHGGRPSRMAGAAHGGVGAPSRRHCTVKATCTWTSPRSLPSSRRGVTGSTTSGQLQRPRGSGSARRRRAVSGTALRGRRGHLDGGDGGLRRARQRCRGGAATPRRRRQPRSAVAAAGRRGRRPMRRSRQPPARHAASRLRGLAGSAPWRAA